MVICVKDQATLANMSCYVELWIGGGLEVDRIGWHRCEDEKI